MDANRINSAVGAELRAARARRGWSREELAEKSGVSPASIKRYEGGTRAIPVDVLVCLIDVLKIDIADIDRAIQRSDDEDAEVDRLPTGTKAPPSAGPAVDRAQTGRMFRRQARKAT
nr:helix-turn-helix transcriptional regulator [Mycobacterium eburneum]